MSQVPGIAAGNVGAYVGAPLTGREGLVVGSICVMDRRARQISPAQIQRLVEFGAVVASARSARINTLRPGRIPRHVTCHARATLGS